MYGIRVPISRDDYLWVIQDPRKNNNRLVPLLFDTIEEATEYARAYGVFAVVERYKK